MIILAWPDPILHRSSISARTYIANDNALCEIVSGDQRLESDINFLLHYPTIDLNKRLGLYRFWENNKDIVSCCIGI